MFGNVKRINCGITVLSIGLVTGLVGCGGSNEPAGEVYATKILVPARSSSEFAEHVKANFRKVGAIRVTDISNESGRVAAEFADTAMISQVDKYSGTNLIETGVDEADLVKFDGQFTFTVKQPTGYNDLCCDTIGIAADTISIPYDPPPPKPAQIHVHRTSESAAVADWVSSVSLSESSGSVQGLYLHGNRAADSEQIISVNTTFAYGWGYWSDQAKWEGGKTSIHFFDANDPAALKETQKLEWQGYYVDSRVVDGVLYVVSRHTPKLEGFRYYPADSQQEESNKALIESLRVDEILPKLMINDGAEQELVAAENCFIPQTDEFSWPSILTITAISLDNPTAPGSSCTLASNGGVYASTNALYLSLTTYADNNLDNITKTQIHKFAFASSGATYRGSGEVKGDLGWNSGSSFRMSEKDGILRVLTTSRSGEEINHTLTVLAESTAKSESGDLVPVLSPVVVLPNDNHPKKIGKPREDIYGVRFLGDRGYVVTFQQTDPLYILDLSEPTDPFIAGELEIPGFSEYLQLLDEDTLLGVGRGGSRNQEVQVSLFDVADPANPSLVETAIAGQGSEASYDYHAIAWMHDPDTGQTKFAFPVTRYGDSVERGLAFYAIDTESNHFVVEDFMNIENPMQPGSFYGSARSLIQGDALHYIKGHHIWSAAQSDLGEVVGPQGP